MPSVRLMYTWGAEFHRSSMISVVSVVEVPDHRLLPFSYESVSTFTFEGSPPNEAISGNCTTTVRDGSSRRPGRCEFVHLQLLRLFRGRQLLPHRSDGGESHVYRDRRYG